MDIEEKLEQLNKKQLIDIINWTRRDLQNAGQNKQLNSFVRGWCRMLKEAVEYQISKAFKSLVKEEE
jgi:hypothetical protein